MSTDTKCNENLASQHFQSMLILLTDVVLNCFLFQLLGFFPCILAWPV